MALQTQVKTAVAVAVPGDLAVPDQAMYYPVNLEAGSAGVECGKFVYVSSGAAVNAGAGAPLGIAQRNLSYPNYTVTSGASLVIPEGQPVQTVTRGDVYVKIAASANVGDKVYVDGSGNMAFSSASGRTDTGWAVATAGVSGATVVIYKH